MQNRFFSFSDPTCERITKSLIPQERINSFLLLPELPESISTTQVSGKGSGLPPWGEVGCFGSFETTGDSDGNDTTEL